MKIWEIIILIFTAIIMGDFVVKTVFFTINILIDILKDRRKK